MESLASPYEFLVYCLLFRSFIEELFFFLPLRSLALHSSYFSFLFFFIMILTLWFLFFYNVFFFIVSLHLFFWFSIRLTQFHSPRPETKGLSVHEELDVVYKALAERESDLQVAAQIGQSLLSENQKLSAQMADVADSQTEMKKVKARMSQLEHLQSSKDEHIDVLENELRESNTKLQAAEQTIAHDSGRSPSPDDSHLDQMHEEKRKLEVDLKDAQRKLKDNQSMLHVVVRENEDYCKNFEQHMQREAEAVEEASRLQELLEGLEDTHMEESEQLLNRNQELLESLERTTEQLSHEIERNATLSRCYEESLHAQEQANANILSPMKTPPSRRDGRRETLAGELDSAQISDADHQSILASMAAAFDKKYTATKTQMQLSIDELAKKSESWAAAHKDVKFKMEVQVKQLTQQLICSRQSATDIGKTLAMYDTKISQMEHKSKQVERRLRQDVRRATESAADAAETTAKAEEEIEKIQKETVGNFKKLTLRVKDIQKGARERTKATE